LKGDADDGSQPTRFTFSPLPGVEDTNMLKDQGPVEVDDAEVARIVALVVKNADFEKTTAEERADVAYNLAVGHAKMGNTTTAWAEELGRRVRQRILWAKPPAR
jgi:glycerol kinase